MQLREEPMEIDGTNEKMPKLEKTEVAPTTRSGKIQKLRFRRYATLFKEGL